MKANGGVGPFGSTNTAVTDETPSTVAYPAPTRQVVHEPTAKMLLRWIQQPGAPADPQSMLGLPKPSSYIQTKSACRGLATSPAHSVPSHAEPWGAGGSS